MSTSGAHVPAMGVSRVRAAADGGDLENSPEINENKLRAGPAVALAECSERVGVGGRPQGVYLNQHRLPTGAPRGPGRPPNASHSVILGPQEGSPGSGAGILEGSIQVL